MMMENSNLKIEPCFVNHRKIFSRLPDFAINEIDRLNNLIPHSIMDWEKPMRINWNYARIFTDVSSRAELPTLSMALSDGIKQGQIIMSIENFEPNATIYEIGQTCSKISPKVNSPFEIVVKYDTDKIISSTMRSELGNGHEFGIIAEVSSIDGNNVVLRPFLMGFPRIYDSSGDLKWVSTYEEYQIKVNQIEEFSKVNYIDLPLDSTTMQNIKEAAFKACLIKILGGDMVNDWGGETCDLFTEHLHYKEKEFRGAFLLKGPAAKGPMKMRHLGNNADQILRLCKTPAEIVFVQHHSDIGEDVIEHLQNTAVTLQSQKHYCLMDGRESLRLLQAYDLVDYALNYEAK